MADYMDPKNYKNMIEALNNFASKTEETCRDLNTACTQCTNVLGQDDIASPKIITRANAICKHYQTLIEKTKALAEDMKNELEKYYERERRGSGDQEGGEIDGMDDDF